MVCLGTFSKYTVVNQASCVKILDDIPLDKACLVGCGVTTGWGSSVYAAEVRPGDNVAVIGVGGIGASAVQGARLAGAERIFAIDTVELEADTRTQLRGHAHRGVDRGGLRAHSAGDLGTDVRQGDLRHGRRIGCAHGLDSRPDRQAWSCRGHQHPPDDAKPTSH